MQRTTVQRSMGLGRALRAAATLAILGGLGVSWGCSGPAPAPETVKEPVTASAGMTGAQLWEQTCMRCHNLRSPGLLSDSQWEAAVHHMRVRANLTGEEQRKILAFLKSAN